MFVFLQFIQVSVELFRRLVQSISSVRCEQDQEVFLGELDFTEAAEGAVDVATRHVDLGSLLVEIIPCAKSFSLESHSSESWNKKYGCSFHSFFVSGGHRVLVHIAISFLVVVKICYRLLHFELNRKSHCQEQKQ